MLDRFHIVARLNELTDQVRAEEAKRLRAEDSPKDPSLLRCGKGAGTVVLEARRPRSSPAGAGSLSRRL